MTAPEENDGWQDLKFITPPFPQCGMLVINNASADGPSRAEVRICEITTEPIPQLSGGTGSLRTIHVIDDNSSWGTVQDLYLDKDANCLRPNLTFVNSTGAVAFETNEIGLKGDAIDPARRLAVVWGDSVVFGVGRGWPCLLDDLVPGYQFLNGGIEGDSY